MPLHGVPVPQAAPHSFPVAISPAQSCLAPSMPHHPVQTCFSKSWPISGGPFCGCLLLGLPGPDSSYQGAQGMNPTHTHTQRLLLASSSENGGGTCGFVCINGEGPPSLSLQMNRISCLHWDRVITIQHGVLISSGMRPGQGEKLVKLNGLFSLKKVRFHVHKERFKSHRKNMGCATSWGRGGSGLHGDGMDGRGRPGQPSIPSSLFYGSDTS